MSPPEAVATLLLGIVLGWLSGLGFGLLLRAARGWEW